MMTHQSVLPPTWTFSPSSEVATMWQTDGTAYKLKPRSFHKSAHLQVHSADFHPGVNCAWHHARFDCFESMIDIDYIRAWVFDKFFGNVVTHWNDYLFSWGTLSDHGDPQFGFIVWTVDDFMNLFDFLVWEIWECLLNFQCFLNDVLWSRWARLIGQRSCICIRLLLLGVSILFEVLW